MILIVGVGNILRNDDGIGALIIEQIDALKWPGVETQVTQQLHLEAIEDFLPYEKIIIVDASSDDSGCNFQKINISSETAAMASSHHLSLQILLSLAKKIYNRDLNLYLCKIKGKSFEIGDSISPEVQACIPKAIELISMEIKISFQIDVFGIVQGVGFRPHLFNSLRKLNLVGTIQNRGDCVRLILEGSKLILDNFLRDIENHIPAMAKIEQVKVVEIALQNFSTLEILISESGENFEVSIPPDLATCSDCFNEFYDPKNKRYLYPFIACTNCGPRYTVVENMPYDRENTSLKKFPLCADCLTEYQNPQDRRFHAESMACKNCGPNIWMENIKGERLLELDSQAISKRLVSELKNGKIIAIRALGGFQLICDARNSEAVTRLRQKKMRPNQSLALMACNLEIIKSECILNSAAEEILQSPMSPIVILESKQETSIPMEQIAPDLYTIGVMLPTTPLHHLLFGLTTNAFDFLVVTSGNARGEPIAISNQEARDSLSTIADFFLFHDRDILRRADDSIATISDGQIQFWRQARGIAPNRFQIPTNHHKNILALGPELKNTITLSFGQTLITSPHLGTLDNPVAAAAFIEMCEKLPDFYQKKIDLIAIDKHPNYFSSQYGRELALKLNLPCVEIQHHHAHAKAVMTEHHLDDAIAIVFDGTGFGDDGTLWGGELLSVNRTGFSRLGHLMPFPLPGGAKAILEPWRIALNFCDSRPTHECAKIFNQTEEKVETIRLSIKKGLNSPMTSSIGRLFDAASALLEISPHLLNYEAEAAIKLEKWAMKSPSKSKLAFPYKIILSNGKIILDPSEMMNDLLVADKKLPLYKMDLAYRFHFTIANMIVDFSLFAIKHSPHTSEKNIVLTGGVFQNKLLLKLATNLLRDHGLVPIMSKAFSPGDGQISMGQAMIARACNSRTFSE
jgi:hydrogenase maturation protein HypF